MANRLYVKDAVSDLVLLEEISEDNILKSLKARHAKVSAVLCSVLSYVMFVVFVVFVVLVCLLYLLCWCVGVLVCTLSLTLLFHL